MSRLWSDIVHQLSPYVPGEQPTQTDVIKLNTNENPYPPSPAVAAALQHASGAGLRLYPPPDGGVLREAIAEQFALSKAHVFVGNGSDEVLAHTFQALLKRPQPLRFPDITYAFYPVYCRLFGIDYETMPLTADLAIDIDAYRGPTGGIIFPNPNAPTGRLLPLEQIATLARHHPDAVVVVDEAYIDFGGTSASCLIPELDNLLVIQTLSKSRALAGLRVGFALGQPHLIDALQRVKDSFNSYPVGSLAIAGATAALRDHTYFHQLCQRIMATRERFSAALTELGFTVLPSSANFVLARPPIPAEEMMTFLRSRNIIVRHFNQPRIRDYLRITIGTDEQCTLLLDAARERLA